MVQLLYLMLLLMKGIIMIILPTGVDQSEIQTHTFRFLNFMLS